MDKMTASTTYVGPAVSTMIGNKPSVSNRALTGAINPDTYRQYSDIDYMTPNPMNIQIHRAVNGFVVRCGINQGETYSVHIAKTVEEVNEIITTELVLKKMEGK